jgi:hypothetical protein
MKAFEFNSAIANIIRYKNKTKLKTKVFQFDKELAENKKINNMKQPTANSQQPTANSQQPTANSQQPTANSQQPSNNNNIYKQIFKSHSVKNKNRMVFLYITDRHLLTTDRDRLRL